MMKCSGVTMPGEFDNQQDFREALMELESILDALEGSKDAARRDELMEDVLHHEESHRQ